MFSFSAMILDVDGSLINVIMSLMDPEKIIRPSRPIANMLCTRLNRDDGILLLTRWSLCLCLCLRWNDSTSTTMVPYVLAM